MINASFTDTLRDWQGFYQVMGESSATLMGLMFVSISLLARLITPKVMPLVRTITTPVLGHFLMALALSALMCFPTQTRLGLASEIGVIGAVGLWRSVLILQVMQRHKQRLHLEPRHWISHLVLPVAGSICLSVAGAGLWRNWPPALDVLAPAVLLLVVTGVVNAWEIAFQSFQALPEEMEYSGDL